MNNREFFNFIFQAAYSHPWLANKEDALFDLLVEECDNQEEKNIVIEIIERFEYISNEKLTHLLKELTKSIINEPGAFDHNSQVVAMAADSAPDSSGRIIYYLKRNLQEHGWEDHLMVNRYDQSFKIFNRYGRKHTNIFLVDDFIGSGQTVIGRAKRIKQIYSEQGANSIEIKARTIAATKEGLKAAHEEGIDAASIIEINKAIDDFNPPEEAHRKVLAMKRIEENLSTEYKGRDMPSLGYGEAQSAYYIEDSNTSNNVFPVFWWPVKRCGNKRRTILVRAAGDA